MSMINSTNYQNLLADGIKTLYGPDLAHKMKISGTGMHHICGKSTTLHQNHFLSDNYGYVPEYSCKA